MLPRRATASKASPLGTAWRGACDCHPSPPPPTEAARSDGDLFARLAAELPWLDRPPPLDDTDDGSVDLGVLKWCEETDAADIIGASPIALRASFVSFGTHAPTRLSACRPLVALRPVGLPA